MVDEWQMQEQKLQIELGLYPTIIVRPSEFRFYTSVRVESWFSSCFDLIPVPLAPFVHHLALGMSYE